MESLFGVAFNDLTAEHVRSFLESAGDEGLTWEAKGDLKNHEWVHRDTVRKAVCAFANGDRPGVLIIGADRKDRRSRWTFDGLKPPPGDDEPTAWLSRTIRDGIQPFVRAEVGPVWELAEDRIAVAVLVHPSPERPCITGDGRVFIRTSGESVPVTDPAVLTRLSSQGSTAVDRAKASALRSLQWLDTRLGSIPWDGEGQLWPAATEGRLTLSTCAVGYAADIGSRLFDKRRGERMEMAFMEEFGRRCDDGPIRSARFTGMRQDHLAFLARSQFDHGDRGKWAMTVDWSGAATVATSRPEILLSHLGEALLSPMLRLAASAVEELGGEGRLRVLVTAECLSLGGGVVDATHVGLWAPATDELPDDLVPRAVTELRRDSGETVWWPEENEPG